MKELFFRHKTRDHLVLDRVAFAHPILASSKARRKSVFDCTRTRVTSIDLTMQIFVGRKLKANKSWVN